MNGWERVGTVAAIVAALAGIGAFVVSWVYGRRADRGSTKALRYERLREARELVGAIRATGDGARWLECNEAAAHLRAVLVAVGDDEFPSTRKLANTEWNLDSYSSENFPGQVKAARAELEAAFRRLSPTPTGKAR
ncbi:MAG: hypothetical protein E6G67_12805 [Actinobacteria bacterium]|nr:MAG: hypothetical protein E6G67_12805 [Actinomycetota bacterium]